MRDPDPRETPRGPRPDPSRVGGIRWLERTNGALTPTERRRLIVPILRGQAEAVAGRVVLLTGRRSQQPVSMPSPPDSSMAREAEAAAADQPAALLGHAHRTWAFGRALAAVDGEERIDEELFYVASLLHDVGLVEAVTGEDFTLRSAAAAGAVVDGHRGPDDVECVRDAISAHATPGATPDSDGPEAAYVQAGATCDLGGLRLHHLSEADQTAVLERYPRAGLRDELIPRIEAEADAVPRGRFALLRRTGFTLAIRMAPFAAG